MSVITCSWTPGSCWAPYRLIDSAEVGRNHRGYLTTFRVCYDISQVTQYIYSFLFLVLLTLLSVSLRAAFFTSRVKAGRAGEPELFSAALVAPLIYTQWNVFRNICYVSVVFWLAGSSRAPDLVRWQALFLSACYPDKRFKPSRPADNAFWVRVSQKASVHLRLFAAACLDLSQFFRSLLQISNVQPLCLVRTLDCYGF